MAPGGMRLACIAAMAVLTSCQLYKPSPLNPSSHLESWRLRGLPDEKVRDFAKRLQSNPSGTTTFHSADGLDLAEAELVALVFNPDLRVARLKAGVAKADVMHAGRWDDPALGIDVLKVTDSVPEPWILSSSLSLTIPISGRLAVEKKRAKAKLHAELSRVAEDEWQTLHDLRHAWLEWSANHMRVKEAQRLVDSLETIVETTGKLTQSGELPRTESALFKIEQESRRAKLARLRGLVKQGEAEIRALMGISPTAPVNLIASLAGNEGKKRNTLEANNPTLVRLRNEYEVSELALLREIRKQYPDIEIGPQFEEDQGQSRLGIIGGIPLPILNSNKRGIAVARAERELARAAFETELERMEGKLAAVQARLAGVRSQRASIDSNLVPLVDQQLEDARKLLDLGEGNSLVLLESLVRAHEAKLELIEARLEESAAQNKIRQIYGPDILKAKTTQQK